MTAVAPSIISSHKTQRGQKRPWPSFVLLLTRNLPADFLLHLIEQILFQALSQKSEKEENEPNMNDLEPSWPSLIVPGGGGLLMGTKGGDCCCTPPWASEISASPKTFSRVLHNSEIPLRWIYHTLLCILPFPKPHPPYTISFHFHTNVKFSGSGTKVISSPAPSLDRLSRAMGWTEALGSFLLQLIGFYTRFGRWASEIHWPCWSYSQNCEHAYQIKALSK